MDRKIGFFQFDVVFGDKIHNLGKVADALLQQDFDLMVLPELFTTGFLFMSREEALAYAEKVPEGDTTQALCHLARLTQSFIVGGLVEVEGDRVYNTAVVVGPRGFVGKHRKKHLTKLEMPLFDRGNGSSVFDLDGISVGIVLCYESWFPEAARQLALAGAEVLCNPGNFVRSLNLDITRLRSLENIVFTVTANRIGMEKRNGKLARFRGDSQIVRPDGVVVQRASDQETLAIVDVDPQQARHKTNRFYADLYRELDCYGMPHPDRSQPGDEDQSGSNGKPIDECPSYS